MMLIDPKLQENGIKKVVKQKMLLVKELKELLKNLEKL
jgi:hypothetical protein